MEYNNTEIGGKSFYQSEPLIARLRGIIRDYPEGVGIIKELIQNADDAKATKVEIILDWRNHQPMKLPDNRMSKLMGASMLVYNNQVFTDKDFDSIRSLGQSEKAQDLQKTGRFGVGFNAIYHITDYPSFISRDRIIFFDPHGAAIPGTSIQEPGREWNFIQAEWYNKYPDFMRVYEAGGLPFGCDNFQGTLFRLPLRTEFDAQNSEIRKQAFSENNIRELIQELIESGEDLLIFLKSVQEIRVYEIPADSDGTRQEILAIITKNQTEVTEARQKILNTIPDNPETLLKLCRNNPTGLASVSYRHDIETITGKKTINSTWRVVNIIRIDEGNELAQVIEAMHQQQEKVIPWSGAAARITTSNTQGNDTPVKGKVYCFLPLPIQADLPIHINGFFNLNSSRDNLSSDSGQTGKDRPRAIWNQLLVRHVLSHACANLIVDLVQDIGEDNPEEFYKLWIVNKITVSKALEELHHYVINILYHKNVIRSAVNQNWITPQTGKILPSKEWYETLLQPLSADNIDIPNPPLPDSIVSAFKSIDCSILIFSPDNLRKHLSENKPLGVSLQDAPKASLRNQEWIVNMLKYCISDNHNDLSGLPLAILANDTLQVFGYNPIGTIYIADTAAREIFMNYSEWFINLYLYSQVPTIYNKIGVTNMDAAEVAKKLVYVITSTESDTYSWHPDALNLPNADWLTKVYNYFANIHHKSLPKDDLQVIPLVPGDDGKLHKGGLIDTPLLSTYDISKETLEAVKYFRIPLVKASKNLEQAITLFAHKHPETLIWCVTGADVLDTLYSYYDQGLPAYNQKYYTFILNFLAEETSYDEERKKKLRQLSIYPTNSHEIVSLNDENVYIPGDGYEPPEIAGTLRLLKLGTTKHEWLPFFQHLEVPVLNRATLIKDCLLDEYSSFSPEEQLIALAWIRDNLSAARKDVEAETFKKLYEEIKKARLVKCTDGRLRSPALIYNPESEVVHQILGNKAAIPDMEYYAEDSALWREFFEKLGMQSKPNADDLLNCIDNLIQSANRSGMDTVADTCLHIFNYILENWEDLKDAKLVNNSKLMEILKDKPWLPVERNPDKLLKYASAMAPENKLYRAKDVCFVQDAHLVASKKPIFARHQRDLLKIELRNTLGFQPIDENMVLDHFETIIRTLEND